NVFLKGFIEVHPEKEIIGVALARIVRRDHRRWRREELFQSIKKESVDVGKMACMLVRGPLPDSRTLVERRRLDLPYQRHHDAWCSLERLNYGRRIHECLRRSDDEPLANKYRPGSICGCDSVVPGRDIAAGL